MADIKSQLIWRHGYNAGLDEALRILSELQLSHKDKPNTIALKFIEVKKKLIELKKNA